MLEFQQSEQTQERRRWILVLVDSSDGVTGKTGQTGTVMISKNGGAAVASTNNIVEVDAGDMPGHYYIELTATELNTLGLISIYYKAATTLAFHDRAIVSYNDPYVMQGGFSAGASDAGPLKLSQKNIEDIAEAVWKYKVKGTQQADVTLVMAAEHPTVDLSGIESQIKDIVIPETDLTEVLESIARINIPIPTNYSGALSAIEEALKSATRAMGPNTENISAAIREFEGKMRIAGEEINSSLSTVDSIKEGFAKLDELVQTFTEKLAEQTDMDRRFGAMGAKMNTEAIESVRKDIAKLAKSLVDTKYDILQEIEKA